MRRIVAIALAAMLGACATGPEPSFHKDDMSGYQKDAYECQRDTLAVASPYTFGRGFVADYNARQFAIACMRARGYEFY